MTIVTIHYAVPSDPHEVQEWLNANPTAVVVAGWTWQNYVYLITNP